MKIINRQMQKPIITSNKDAVTIYGATLAFNRYHNGLMARIWYKNKSHIYTSDGNRPTLYFETLLLHAAIHRVKHDSV